MELVRDVFVEFSVRSELTAQAFENGLAVLVCVVGCFTSPAAEQLVVSAVKMATSVELCGDLGCS